MGIFSKGKKTPADTQNIEDFSDSSFPFLINDSFEPSQLKVAFKPAAAPINEEPKAAPMAEEPKAAPTPKKINTTPSAASPLQSVMNSVKQTAAELKKEVAPSDDTPASAPAPEKPAEVKAAPAPEIKAAPATVPMPEIKITAEEKPAEKVVLVPEEKTEPKPKPVVTPAPATQPEPEAEKTPVAISKPEEKTQTVIQLQPEPVSKTEAEEKPIKKSNLLAKCMPYIYDDDGINYVEEKPNYTLESVEDIIQSVEKRANEKIAKMYSLKSVEVESIGTEKTEDEKPVRLTQNSASPKPSVGTKIGEEVKPTSLFDTAAFPKVSDTLFDDFSARRTEVSEDATVTTTYTQLNNQQPAADEGHTRALPDLKVDGNTHEIFEDISSHTRIIDKAELPRFSHKPDINYDAPDEEEEVVADDFRGAEDIKRVGSDLKYNMLTARLRLIATAVLTLLAGLMHIPFIKYFFEDSSLLAGITAIVLFAAAALINLNVFASFKTAFTKKAGVELPLAFALCFMAGYLVFEVITANYVWDIIILPLLSVLAYDFCAYLKQHSIWNNFKLVALRRSKTAVALIDDTATTYAMARSVIEGDILAAGSRETEEVEDFLKHSYTERSFSGRINSFTIASLSAAITVAIVIGISHSSFSDAFCAAASILCLSAAPSLFIADMLPFAGLSARLSRLRAAVCSKYSAERIELLNAVVLSSSDIFPEGTIKLYSMSPLSANNLDETIALAATVANAANSPLKHLFNGMLSEDMMGEEADSVKYEDSLGISGWVGDNHIMIGNRSLMQAHGVRIPALEVDRKILHKGFFPVYVACDQRACALLTVKYTIDRDMEYELGRLADKGVTLLVDNCDPNITEEMLCDYYSLYPDLVKLLDHHGTQRYKNAVSPTKSVSAHGFYKGDALGFISMLNGCIRLRLISNILCVTHIICAAVCWLVYTGASISGIMLLMSAAVCTLCALASLVISLVVYFIGKP